MNLYLLYMTDPVSWDEYESMVVAATDRDDAFVILMDGLEYETLVSKLGGSVRTKHSHKCFGKAWACELLGKATEGIARGVISIAWLNG